MDTTIFLAVLVSALMHAGWNAVIKGAGDPFVSVTQISLVSGSTAAVLLPFVAVPQPAAWKWLLISAFLHTSYRLFLIGAYRAGDLTQIYPISRGAAPLMTAIGSTYLLMEPLTVAGYLAVASLSVGVFLMSMKGGRLGTFERRATLFALATAASTCCYSLVDGWGARVNGSGPSFAIWMFVFNAVAMQSIALLWRGREVYRTLPQNALSVIGGGWMSMSAYFIVIWAMTQAPIALVAALRETSVLFAALIGLFVLREPMTGWRIAAALSIVAGVALLRIA